jgi:hypothetical protein
MQRDQHQPLRAAVVKLVGYITQCAGQDVSLSL